MSREVVSDEKNSKTSQTHEIQVVVNGKVSFPNLKRNDQENVKDFDLSTANGGGLYTGPLLGGRPDGSGTWVGTSGELDKAMYQGSFQGGQFSGEGVMVVADGKQFAGEWSEGKPHGTGVAWDANGKVSFSGQWDHGTQTKVCQATQAVHSAESEVICTFAKPSTNFLLLNVDGISLLSFDQTDESALFRAAYLGKNTVVSALLSGGDHVNRADSKVGHFSALLSRHPTHLRSPPPLSFFALLFVCSSFVVRLLLSFRCSLRGNYV